MASFFGLKNWAWVFVPGRMSVIDEPLYLRRRTFLDDFYR